MLVEIKTEDHDGKRRMVAVNPTLVEYVEPSPGGCEVVMMSRRNHWCVEPYAEIVHRLCVDFPIRGTVYIVNGE